VIKLNSKLKVNDIQMYYESTGEGNPLVLLHGLGSSHRDWFFQVPEFSKHYRVLTPDCRGHGESDKPAGPYSIGLFAYDVIALLDALGIERVHLLGISMGGLVAQQIALDDPARVRSLVLVNTFGRLIIRGFVGRFRVFQRLFLMRLFSMERIAEFIARTLFPKPEQRELFELARERWAQNDKQAYLEATRATICFDVADRLGEIRCPTLIVAGENDSTISMPHKEALQRGIPGSKLVVVKDSGHATPLDQPEEFNRIVLEFLASVQD
jgi:pimeloyl-ACP methyl ester carboxylesterase